MQNFYKMQVSNIVLNEGRQWFSLALPTKLPQMSQRVQCLFRYKYMCLF